MKLETIRITVPGREEEPVTLNAFILDELSADPGRRRPAVIVCEGGGYHRRSDREGEAVAFKFMAMGCHAFILDYSVAPSRFPAALLELAESVAIIRESAERWNIDTEKIIPCGFSAAGHLVCSLGVFWNRKFVWETIGREPKQIEPSAMILCYPVITGGEYAHEGSINQLLGMEADEEKRREVSLELQVSKETPRAFIWHTYTDEAVPVENSLLLAAAMRSHKVNFELHIYPAGGHGLSLASPLTGGDDPSLTVERCQNWIDMAGGWIAGL